MKTILYIVLPLLLSAAYSQQPYLYFNRVTTQNGLSHNKINCIIQDRRGFTWLGTEDGLNRYDGRYFAIFRNNPTDTSTLSGNIITDLLEDKKGIIWIATADGGITKYDYRLPVKRQFRQFKHIDADSTSIPVNIINKIIEDRYGNLWLASSGSYVIRFNKKTEKFDVPVIQGTRSVSSLCIDPGGILWAGRIGGSILKINTATLQYEADERYNDLYAKLPHASITGLFIDSEHNTWYGSWDKVLYKFNASTKKEEVLKRNSSKWSFPNDEIGSFAADSKGNIWMGGHYNGLTIYDRRQNKFFNYQNNPAHEGSVADNHINTIYIDNSGLVWVGTNKGVCTYDPVQHFFEQTFLPKQHNDITIYQFFEKNDRSLWIASSDGIFIQKKDNGEIELRKILYKGNPLAVTRIYKDIDQTYYIGTNYSLFVYDTVNNKVSLLPNTEKDSVMNKIIASRVVSVLRDTIEQHPVLLVSPYGHYITYYDLTEKRWISRENKSKNIVAAFNLQDNLIRKFYKSADGRLWLATSRYGVGEWQKKKTPWVNHLRNNPEDPQSISNNNVFDIVEDVKGNLWLSTYGGGLNYLNTTTKKFTHISAGNNLLEGIQTDDSGRVWMISNGNLHKYDPGQNTFTSFILPDLEKKGGVSGNIFKDRNGNLYVAGPGYFIKFDPSAVKERNKQPQVYFTDFKIFNISYGELLKENKIDLQYNQNYFSFEFSAPDFTGNTVEYAYQLEGVDKDWTNAGTRNFVSYSNLPQGDYTFSVKATNRKGNYTATVTSVKITIIPPFWQRWWFFAICGLLIAGSIYAVYRYRITELLKRQAIRNKIAQDLHDSMGSTLSSISIYSQVAKVYQQQRKEPELQQTIEKIGSTSGEMIAEMSDIVWAINPKNDHMQGIIQRMESYARPLLHAKNIQFHFSYDPLVPSLHLEMNKRKNFYLIFKEVINNAVKYSSCHNIFTNIHAQNNMIELTIMDDGVGFDVEKLNISGSHSLSGNGLNNMYVRAADMKGIFRIESSAKNGTHIQLSFNIP